MTVVYNTTDAMAVGNVTAQLVNSDGGFVPVGPLLSVPAHEDGSWSIELAPNDASVGFSSVWYVTMHQENVPPTSWYLDVPADGPVFVGALDYSEAPNQGINVEQIQAGSGISIDPVDGTGIVTITNTGGGGQLPIYQNPANIQIQSTAGNIELLANDTLSLAGTPIALDYGAGNYQYVYIADTFSNLPDPGPFVPALGYTATNATPNGGATSGASAQFVWNPTFGGNWQPVPQNIGNILVQTYNRGTALFTTLEVCPWYSAQPVGLVSTAGPRGADIYPFATLSAGDNIAVQFNSSLQLLAAGSVAVPGWDYVDIAGTVTVWDAAGTNLLEASFSASQIRSDTGTLDVTFTQVRIVGSDLALATVNVADDSIQTTAGGAYNISTNVYASWD